MILEKVPESNVLQRISELSTGKWVQIVQILLRVLKTSSEDVDASLQQFQKIALDVNELPTHTLERLQKMASQELAEIAEIIEHHLLKS